MESAAAMEELCRSYWYPVYAYIRRSEYSKEDAEDLAQAFFASLLETKSLEGLTSEKGKFRAFLIAALKHFLANEWDHARRQKRGGGAPILSLDWQGAESRYQIDPADALSPDKLYDRAWAMTLLERVLARLSTEHAVNGKAPIFECLKPFLMADRAATPYPDAAAALGLSEAAVRVAVHRLRRRYGDLVREEITQTLSDSGQVDTELKALLGVFTE